MKKFLSLLILFTLIHSHSALASRPDTGYLFAYGTERGGGRNGLHFAWSTDNENWHPIGPEHGFITSDYGTWSGEKRMVSPYLFRGPDNLWHLVWSLNDYHGTFAHSSSGNLINWNRQSYPVMSEENNCLMPEISHDQSTGKFTVSWISEEGSGVMYYSTTTTDFNDYTPAARIISDDRLNNRKKINIRGVEQTGTVHNVSWDVIAELIDAQQVAAYRNLLHSETTSQDPERFARMRNLEATIKVDITNPKSITDMLMGIFFEDINYAADGGIYAELVQNRGFEYHPGDRNYDDDTWNSYKAWSTSGSGINFTIDTVSPIHPNNKHYAILDATSSGGGLVNEGFAGIAIKSGEKYDFSLFARQLEGNTTSLRIRLIGENGQIHGETTINNITSDWQKYSSEITASRTDANSKLEVTPLAEGKIALDMISLFPQNTFMGRENGLRADLAQTLADLQPRFFRFPGGCVAHGDGLGNMYRWKSTIGPLEERVPQRNIWGYHQSAGLGYFEYFQFCEDIGAEPIPIVPAGVPCQNSHTGGAGQQGGIPMCEMDDYVQEILDLIEWANGDVNTTWGRKRAEAGHPEPFNLKYIGIGNEDAITTVFEERFTMIYNEVSAKHPEIILIGTVGPFYHGTDYDEGWDIAEKLDIPIVDEHYYAPPGWYIHNQDFYDKYDRSKSKVYLGEYAAHLPGRPNNIETALAEALHLTNLERNGDIVEMACYAPLLAKEGFTQWNPNLIYFNNTEVKPTVGYHVQRLYGENSGDEYLPSQVTLSANNEAARLRLGVSVVRDTGSDDLILKIVNMMPLEVESTIDLSGFHIPRNDATLTVLKGEPTDREVIPETSTIEVAEEFLYNVPAYSFTIIRIER